MRLPWDNYFMDMAFLAAKRSTCLRRHVGAIAVKDKRILATGYNGAPSGTLLVKPGVCGNRWVFRQANANELCRALHAEQNVIIQAAIHGVSIAGSTIYCTTPPCSICAKMLVGCQIAALVLPPGQTYPDEISGDLLKESGIYVRTISEVES